MSDLARTVLIVTNDLDFSNQVSDLMLRAGVRTIRFAQFANALELTQILAPDLVLIHALREHVAAGWACYQMIQSDATLGSAVALISMPASASLERGVGAQALAAGQPAEQITRMAQIDALLGAALPARQRAAMDSITYPRKHVSRDASDNRPCD